MFFVGQSAEDRENTNILEENEVHGDIVSIDYVESYRNTTYKVVAAMYWANKYCSKVPYVIKLDEDVIVHTYKLLKFLNSRPSIQEFGYFNNVSNYKAPGKILCRVPHWRKVARNKYHKHYVDPAVYPGVNYPEYCFGPWYLMERPVIPVLYEGSYHVPFLDIEDVFLTGVVREKFNIAIEKAVRFDNSLYNVIHNDGIFHHRTENEEFEFYHYIHWQKIIEHY